jgi:hypothetical protein
MSFAAWRLLIKIVTKPLKKITRKKIKNLKNKIMKTRILALAVIILTVISCSNNNDDTTSNLVEGSWVLTEVLIDPGNGSGTFIPVTDGFKVLQFSNDGKLISYGGAVCELYAETGVSSTATYSEINSKISCSNYTIGYELVENKLILDYPGREPVLAKYVRVKQ